MKMITINNFFLKELQYNEGKWTGLYEFHFSMEQTIYSGSIPFTYMSEFQLHGLTYSSSIPNQQRKLIRKAVLEQIQPSLQSLKKMIVDPREAYSYQPVLEKFEVDERQSFQNNFTINFTLKESSIEFTAYIFLYQNAWHCEIKPKPEFQHLPYKRYIHWEDDVFSRLIEHIKKDPNYRMKFVVYAIAYKQKK